MASLNDIPGLGGWLQMDAVNRGREGQQLAQAVQFSTLQQHFQDQAAKRAALERDASFRAGVRPDMTSDQLLQYGLRSGALSPKDLVTTLQGAENKKMQVDANKAIAMDRLNQQVIAEKNRAETAARNASSLEEKNRIYADANAKLNSFRQIQAQIAAGNYNYQTGGTIDLSPMAAPQPSAAPQSQSDAPVTYSFSTPNGPVSGSAANVNGALGTIGRQEVPATAVSPMPAVQPAPVAPAPVVPVPGQGVPAARAAAIPMPPEIAAMPRKKQDEWRLSQEKANAKLNINLAGGRESTFINRVVLAGNQAAADLTNVVKLPMSASRGLFGGRGQGTGLLDAAKESLATAMTTQEVQSYNVLATGFQRSLAAIEAAGLAPSGSLVHQMDSVIFKEGDTNYTKLLKLAQTRQIVDKGLETTLSNPRVPEETKAHIREIMGKIDKAVPFVPGDLLDLQQAQAANPKVTLGEILKQKKAGQASDAPQGVDPKIWAHMTPEEKALWQKK